MREYFKTLLPTTSISPLPPSPFPLFTRILSIIHLLLLFLVHTPTAAMLQGNGGGAQIIGVARQKKSFLFRCHSCAGAGGRAKKGAAQFEQWRRRDPSTGGCGKQGAITRPSLFPGEKERTACSYTEAGKAFQSPPSSCLRSPLSQKRHFFSSFVPPPSPPPLVSFPPSFVFVRPSVGGRQRPLPPPPSLPHT